MNANGTVNMELINQMTKFVREYKGKKTIEDSGNKLSQVYEDCSNQVVPFSNICEAGDTLRMCILKKRSEYEVKGFGDSIWM